MSTVHAFFSAQTALRVGSAVFRKPSGGTVNVTRVGDSTELQRQLYDERYIGEVLPAEDGGSGDVRRVPGISDR